MVLNGVPPLGLPRAVASGAGALFGVVPFVGGPLGVPTAYDYAARWVLAGCRSGSYLSSGWVGRKRAHGCFLSMYIVAFALVARGFCARDSPVRVAIPIGGSSAEADLGFWPGGLGGSGLHAGRLGGGVGADTSASAMAFPYGRPMNGSTITLSTGDKIQVIGTPDEVISKLNAGHDGYTRLEDVRGLVSYVRADHVVSVELYGK